MNTFTEPRTLFGAPMPEGVCTAADLVQTTNDEYSLTESAELHGDTARLWNAGFGIVTYMEATRTNGDSPHEWNCRIWRMKGHSSDDHTLALAVLVATEPPHEIVRMDPIRLSVGKTYPEYMTVTSITHYVLTALALYAEPARPPWLRQRKSPLDTQTAPTPSS